MAIGARDLAGDGGPWEFGVVTQLAEVFLVGIRAVCSGKVADRCGRGGAAGPVVEAGGWPRTALPVVRGVVGLGDCPDWLFDERESAATAQLVQRGAGRVVGREQDDHLLGVGGWEVQ